LQISPDGQTGKDKLQNTNYKPAYIETATYLRTEMLKHACVQAGIFQLPKIKNTKPVVKHKQAYI